MLEGKSWLDFHPNGTHSLQRIQWWESDVTPHFFPNLFWWRNKLIYISDGLRVGTFQQFCIFGWTIPLIHVILYMQLLGGKASSSRALISWYFFIWGKSTSQCCTTVKSLAKGSDFIVCLYILLVLTRPLCHAYLLHESNCITPSSDKVSIATVIVYVPQRYAPNSPS